MGDRDGDTVIGKARKNPVLTMVKIKTLFTVVKLIETKHPEITADALIKSMLPMKGNIHTITLDNGKKFAQHERIAKALEANVYFAHPYSSWGEVSMRTPMVYLGVTFPKKQIS